MDLPYVDTHTVSVDASPDQVWRALRAYADRALLGPHRPVVRRLLGTRPDSGFAVASEDPGRRLELAGRHRFSRYVLVFELADAAAGGTDLSAVTYAVFPHVHGFAYRTLVIGSHLHVVATRAMLRSIARRAGRARV